MPLTALFRIVPFDGSRLAMAGAALASIMLAIWFLASDMVRQVAIVSESPSDNAQWVLSQLELELLYLVNAADSGEHGLIGPDEVRLRFDIFYGRLKMVREGEVFNAWRQAPGFAESFDKLNGFLEAHLPFIDGEDAALISDLPLLNAQARALTAEARNLALIGVRVSAKDSDARRLGVMRTLMLTGALTAVLVAFLVAMVVLLLRLVRFNRLRAAENMATLSRLDAVVSTAMEALITVDPTGRIVDFNEAACQTYGLPRQTAIGTEMAGLFAPQKGEPPLFRPGRAPDVAGQGRFRLTARHADGRLFPVEVAISNATGPTGDLAVVFLRDLSAQLAAEQALVAARDKALRGEKAKAELLAVMSHEIRTPLNGMIGTIELLDATPLSDRQREYLRILQASGRLLMHHVNDVLDVSRLDSGRAAPVVGPVDLAEVVREVIQNQLPASEASGNRLASVADGRPFVVQADGAQLRQVLLNLVGNAVKFTRNGKIFVELAEDAKAGITEIRVSDTGIGISPADQDRIFDDFVTLDASYARGASGTGLGLGIVRRIVAQMGGSLTLDSAVGQGSTFRVRLPMARQPVAEAPASALPVAPAARALRALVVEDNDFNRLIVMEFLRQEGHFAVEAVDGEQGIALAMAQGFDVILMDISMPGMDGLQAAQAIRRGAGASSDSPIVAMTAHALAEEMARFRAGGMAAVLVKPITREALRLALAQAVPPTGTDSEALIDTERLEALAQDLGQDRARALVARFRDEATETLARVRGTADLSAADADVRRGLHRLAGSAAMFGAIGLNRVLAGIESGWKTGRNDDMATAATRLEQVWRATEAAFQDVPLAQPSSLR